MKFNVSFAGKHSQFNLNGHKYKIMKLNKIIAETPLPDDWDKEVYNKPNASFASQLRYAQERAAKLGRGSSRAVFNIKFQGRETALKIATNKKGLAQNEFEADILSDYYIKDLGIAIPLIDFDTENEPPRWIHTEKAEKMKPTQFKKFFGVSHNEIQAVINYGTGKNNNLSAEVKEWMYDEDNPHHDYISALIDLVGNYGIPSGDFTRLANWGVYKGHPVIIDIGLSNEVAKQHYS